MNKANPDNFYQQVTEEMSQGIYDQDLWDKAYYESESDENRALAKYKVLRVRRLSGNEEKFSDEEKPIRISSEEVAALPDVSRAPEPEPEPQLESRIVVKTHRSVSSFIFTAILYFCLISVIGYTGRVFEYRHKAEEEKLRKHYQNLSNEGNKIRGEWEDLQKSPRFKRLSDSEKKKIQAQYDKRVKSTNPWHSTENQTPIFNQRFFSNFISPLLFFAVNLFCIAKLSTHLKTGCLSTFFLTCIPVFGWLILIYYGVKYNFEENQDG